MVGNTQLLLIHQRLQEIMGNNKFGDIHIFAEGDLFQLKPVRDRWIFEDLKHTYGPFAPNLWKQYFTVHELTEMRRQTDDKKFAEMLNRIRIGEHNSINAYMNQNNVKYL